MILMADSIRPLAEIPSSFRVQRNRGVLLYADGDYACSPAVAAAFKRREWISVTPANPQRAARLARFKDVERFDATAKDWPPFRAARDELCHAGTVTGWPGVYCSIDPGPPYGVQQVMDACDAAKQGLPDHWFIAWYGAENLFTPPTAAEVAEEILTITGQHIDPATIDVCQFRTGPYDLSVIYQNPAWA